MSFGPIPPTDLRPTAMAVAPDAASLRDALSVIDDWDHEFSSLFSLETIASSAPSGKAPTAKSQRVADTTAPYKPRRGDARKLEVQELRAQIEDLQRVVESEKAKFVVAKCEDSVEAVALRDEWERMSIRQEEQRFAAQVENEKLRSLVESQRKGAQKIVQLAQRVALLEHTLPPYVAAPFEHFQGPKVDPQVHLKRLDGIEHEADRVFAGGAFARKDRKCFREVQFRDRAPDACGLEVKFEMAWVLPFSVEDVAEAMWIQCTRITNKDRTVEWMDLYEDATAIVSQFISQPTSNENLVVNHGQLATKRLPKHADGSIVFVSSHLAKAFEHSQLKGEGVGDAWIRIERVGTHQPTDRVQSPLSQVKWSRRVVIHPPASECMTPQERTQWVNSVIAGPMRGRVESNLDWTMQAVENILLSSKTKLQLAPED